MRDAVTIREATPEDAASLALVGAATFLESFAGTLDGSDIVAHCRSQHAEEIYREYLTRASARIWIATAMPGGAPVGYLMLDRATLPVDAQRPDDLEIKRVYLLPRFQGSGLGAELMWLAIHAARSREAKRVVLGVYSGNRRAIAFYERHGFRHIGERRFRVGQREYDDYVLGLEL
jgi:ribosomal protein S18 acetylase RimI-like enzyme